MPNKVFNKEAESINNFKNTLLKLPAKDQWQYFFDRRNDFKYFVLILDDDSTWIKLGNSG